MHPVFNYFRMNEKERLFEGFPPVKVAEWEAKISEELKGAAFEKLIWKTAEGFDVRPFYTSKDLEEMVFSDVLPGEFPFIRGDKIAGNDWVIRENIRVTDFSEANKKALQALNRGAGGLGFILPEELKLSARGLETLLKDIVIECIHINFSAGSQWAELQSLFSELVRKRGIDPVKISGSLGIDPLSMLALKGRLEQPINLELKKLAQLIKDEGTAFSNFRHISVCGNLFHNAGANVVQESAIVLSLVSQYMELLVNEGISAEVAARTIQLKLSAGSLYFMEIAKFRAIRILFSKLIKAWGVDNDKVLNPFIHAETSSRNQTVYDHYVNMLRGTTEGMSAVLGGADSLSILPFDHPFRNSTSFSERIARNTQIILKEEAYLDKVADPSAGSYYIEKLTESIVEYSWKLFLEIDSEGGYLQSLKSGKIQNMCSESAAKLEKDISSRREILLGTNQYPDPKETVPADIDLAIAFPSAPAGSGSMEVEPLAAIRGSQGFEKIRIKTETALKRPLVFLLTTGDPVWRKARAGFSTGFFSCAGFEIRDNPGFEDIVTGMKEAATAQADIVVLCSSDAEYSSLVPEALKHKKSSQILVIAGFPKDTVDTLKEMGVEHFIHLKSNVLEDLGKFQSLLGIS